MKTAISLPDPLFKSAEAAAKKLRMTRSRFFATAASHYLKELHKENVTEKLNAVYGEKSAHESRVPEAVDRMQYASLKSGKW
jgi:metal-responsive CopG/Arc/MetJ family transcriptional regulator